MLGYKGFQQQGFRIEAAFDVESAKVGTKIEGVEVHHLDRLPEIVRKNKIRLGLIAVPAQAAQAVADRMVAAGIGGVMNFAPVTLVLPESISQVGVDLAIELEQLSFALVNRVHLPLVK